MNRRELLKALGGLIPGLAAVSAGKAHVDPVSEPTWPKKGSGTVVDNAVPWSGHVYSIPGHTYTFHYAQYQLDDGCWCSERMAELRKNAETHATL